MKKNITYIIVVIVVIFVAISWISPLAFAQDGFLTREKIENFNAQYDLGATRRHSADSKKIYLLYLGFQDVNVQEEVMSKVSDVKANTVMPFLYVWDRNPSAVAYRVSIGEEKYYYTIVIS